ncbi:methyltransferase domain-containing protein [Actinophytocola sp.]|uniref:class I SAM-dependent methyltransferase n=1 Tax=Actinophytocola sp. TaxID=1872138 RepID=UPI00389B11DA
MTTTYVFDNESAFATEQHRVLAELLDPFTTERLAVTGVTRGWRCLEVGAGGGSVARWLADRVAPDGRVLATDIKPHHIRRVPGLDVRRHDITRDPLPRGEFDLIVTRLLLRHLPDRAAVLRRLLAALKPGGWLQIDEFDNSYVRPLLTPDPAASALFEAFMEAKDRVVVAAGNDIFLGRHIAGELRDLGMVDVDPCPRLWTWPGGSPGTRLLIHHSHALRDELLAAGMTDRQLEDVRALLADPGFVASSYVTYSVHARRPGG